MFQKDKEPKPQELNKREWFIIIENRQEGPFSLKDLKRDVRLTPDTLIWREGFNEWIPARFVSELEEIFKDKPESKPVHELIKKPLKTDLGQENPATLTFQYDPYQFLLWILLLLTILLYFFYQY